jgi:hypothetical protein
MGKLPFFVCLVIAAAFCGCSQQNKFVQRISDADRVILTNIYAGDPFGIEVTNIEPKKIVAAISSAQINRSVKASPNLRLEFFKGSNFLGTVNMCVNSFGVDGVQYVDSSGVLEAVDNEYRKKYMAEQIRLSH